MDTNNNTVKSLGDKWLVVIVTVTSETRAHSNTHERDATANSGDRNRLRVHYDDSFCG